MKKGKKMRNKKQFLFLVAVFLAFFVSYSFNFWGVSTDSFYTYERSPEGLVIGKMARSQQEGIFAYGGLTGRNRVVLENGNAEEEAQMTHSAQHDFYLTKKKLPPKYDLYKSQSGGQAILYSVVQEIVPGDNPFKLKVVRGLNAALTALCFMLLIGWIYRNVGFITAAITFLLLLLSPWVNNYGHNLWWSFWSFYIPFLTMLLLLERMNKHPQKFSFCKIGIAISVAVFAKCFFTGFEYITSTLLAVFSPVLYYCIVGDKKMGDFILFSFKVGVCMVLGVLAEMFVLVLQISSLNGSLSEGVEHIIHSYTKRTNLDVDGATENLIGEGYFDILRHYLGGDAFELGFLSNNHQFGFGILLGIICVFAFLVYLKSRKKAEEDKRTNTALLATTAFSLLGPFSWLILFKQHAASHPHIDFIVWYIPFLLYGFMVIGKGIDILLPIKNKIGKNKY